MNRTDCDSAIACIENVFIDQVQKKRIAAGQCPARRPVFLRLHGVAHATLEVLPTPAGVTPAGLFARPASYPAWVRFSSDIPDDRPDLKSTVGVSFKLFDVPGEKSLEPDGQAPTLDFLFQNFPVFFVDDAAGFCSFLQDSEAYIAKHPLTGQLLDEMEKTVPTALGEKVWSVIPFKYSDTWCKYILEPEQAPTPGNPDYNDPNYLAKDLEQRLAAQPFRYRLLMQRRVGGDDMPLDRATARWDEQLSVPLHVATLVIPAQDITTHTQADYGEALAFNPARTLKGFEAVGSIAEARRHIYRVSADLRRNVNGQTVGEPQVPRPTELPVTPPVPSAR
ncbi:MULTISPECIES: hypothetical protein [unclassified Pseudomonas]|uniref:hypothetical protein n=1 Tax=unclassified Pseudomonas TaxID=196821 RepID=UPI000E6ACC49|nr:MULTISPECIES: hypothetical protein [unclassified Pseudomonas]MBM7395973.1 hypothetical protein [Pseudomonas sp. M5]RRV49776.1 hypothetical protein EGJ09_02250 [Pseudomonas sp. p106]HDS1755340.1 hypothetical protein [Pseudomonas putida]